MDTKVKITIITVAALLFIIIGTGLYQILKPQNTGTMDSAKFKKSGMPLNAGRKGGVRSKVVIKNNKYFFPNRNKPKKRVDPSDMDEEIELADDQERVMPPGSDPNFSYEMENEVEAEFMGDVDLEEMKEHSAEMEHH